MGYSVPDATAAAKVDTRVKADQALEKKVSMPNLQTEEDPTAVQHVMKRDDVYKMGDHQGTTALSRNRIDKEKGSSGGGGGVILDWKATNMMKQEPDVASDVSSLTHVVDQEIIEELHQTITELRAELDASRAEAARAVKVAEQAIQSAESCSSNDWNSTVTHKAAEAAAQAQKRSAEAMARQRKAEENLAEERKNADYWRKQADIAEGEVNKLRIRVAAAEVQRYNVNANLHELKSNSDLLIELVKRDAEISDEVIKGKLQFIDEKNRALEALVEKSKRVVKRKDDEIKRLQAALTDAYVFPFCMLCDYT